MDEAKKAISISDARQKRREQVVSIAKSLVGASVAHTFDPVHSLLCALDVVMLAGAPWLKEAIEKDFGKDESGYRKIGGGANSPKMPYFFRSATNLIHFLKRQGLYIPRGGTPSPCPGMACFLDWDDRGRFNFSPDRSGIIIEAKDGHIETIILAVLHEDNFVVKTVTIEPKSSLDLAIIGYSDLP